MAETLINFDTSYTSPRSALSDISDPPLSSVETPFNRKIEFHLARKPFNGFISGGEGFKLETLNPTKPDHHRPGGSKQESGCSGLAAKKPDGSELLDFGLDPELTFRITFRRIGAGLENLGNTCFLNSVLQCLTYTEPLAAYLQSGKHQNSCRTAGFCALCAIQKHVSRALQLSGRSLAPKDLVSNLRCISRSFRNARQEDAHEYMVNLLESMHKCCLPVGVPSESPSAYEKSLVHKIFGGRLRSQVKCTQCSFCSDKFDPFIDLSLEINKAESLNKALSHFTAKEYLDGGERQYQCQKCKHKVKALKQLSIHQAPYVLTIHLKRFGEHQPGQKIDKKVQFGPTLDLKPFVTGPYDGDLKYTLYGVLVHAGWSTHSGHYYCYVRTSSGMWYSLDDHQVRQVGEKVVLEQKAYMLFYVRDRRNSALKKHVGYVQKENVIANAIGNIMHSNSNQGLKGTVQNGPVHKSVNGVDTSAAVTRKDAVITDALKETLMKEASIQKTKDPPLDSSSKVPVSSNAVDRPSDIPVNNSLGATPDGKTNNDCNKERGINKDNTDLIVQAPNNSLWPPDLATKKNQSSVNGEAPEGDDISIKNNLSCSAAIIPKQNGHHSSVGDPSTAEKTPQKIHTEASLRDSDERKSACIGSVRVLHKSSPENRQAKGLFKGSTLADGGQRKGVIGSVGLSVGQTPHVLSKESTLADGGQRKGVIGSVGLSVGQTPHVLSKERTLADGGLRKGVTGSVGLSVGQITCISSHNGAADSKYKRKLKKKLAKCQVNRVHLGSSILFGAYLSLRKKKHKKMKRHIVKIHNLTREHLMDAECSPSTSEITRTLSLDGSVHSRGKGLTSCSTEKGNAKNFEISTCELPKGIMDEEFRDRVGHNGAVCTTDKPPLKNFSSLTGNPSGARGANVSKECSRDTVQYGLEEKTAAPWEGIELPSPQITKSHDVEPLRVGYIGDEWDEEYDRGKRKKVRTSDIVFGGPNPFQVIASKKAKLKKVKMDQSSSGNRPFRI